MLTSYFHYGKSNYAHRKHEVHSFIKHNLTKDPVPVITKFAFFFQVQARKLVKRRMSVRNLDRPRPNYRDDTEARSPPEKIIKNTHSSGQAIPDLSPISEQIGLPKIRKNHALSTQDFETQVVSLKTILDFISIHEIFH